MSDYTPNQLMNRNGKYSRGLFESVKNLKRVDKLTPTQGIIVQQFGDMLTELNDMLYEIIKNRSKNVTESYDSLVERRNNLSEIIKKALDANQISPDENNLLLHFRKLLKINTELALLVHQNR